jgi:hypothetical protein
VDGSPDTPLPTAITTFTDSKPQSNGSEAAACLMLLWYLHKKAYSGFTCASVKRTMIAVAAAAATSGNDVMRTTTIRSRNTLRIPWPEQVAQSAPNTFTFQQCS